MKIVLAIWVGGCGTIWIVSDKAVKKTNGPIFLRKDDPKTKIERSSGRAGSQSQNPQGVLSAKSTFET